MTRTSGGALLFDQSRTYDAVGNVASATTTLPGGTDAQASVLYDPYGNVRYSNGAMPGSYGFTGQRADGATGLDDYGARYYDPVAGQFVSADTVADGLSRYGYVAGNPESWTDPTGHLRCETDDSGHCMSGGGGSGGSNGSGAGNGGNGGGGSNNPATGTTHDCKSDLSDTSDTCAQYRDWETRMRAKRWTALTNERIAAGVTLLVASVINIVIDVAIMVKSKDLVTRILAAVDALTTMYEDLPAAAIMLFATEGVYGPNADLQNAAAGFGNGVVGTVLLALAGLAATAQKVVGVLKGAITVIRQLGWFGRAVADGAMNLGQSIIGGPGTAVLNLLLTIAPQAWLVAAAGMGHLAVAVGFAAKGGFDHELNMEIEDWCGQNTGACDPAPQRYDTA